MPYLLGSLTGALVVTFLLSRLVRWALKFMGDTLTRVMVTAALTYALAIIAQGFGNADGGPWNPGSSWGFYAVGVAVWAAMDWYGLKSRATKARGVSRP